MAKIIAEKAQEAVDSPKIIEIKHTRTMKDASGKDVEVVDFVDVKELNVAISECEQEKANLESRLSDCEAELAEYIAIRDAE